MRAVTVSSIKAVAVFQVREGVTQVGAGYRKGCLLHIIINHLLRAEV
jgi:hypothetical protein